MQDLKQMWANVLSKLESMVSFVSYELWIETLEVLDYTDKLILVATSPSAKRQLIKNHLKELTEAIESVFGEDTKYEVLDPEEKEEYLKKNKPQEKVIEPDDSKRMMFNPKYTFDNFIVGKSNQFCYAAARAVAENPGYKFNPLFIYGGVGLGKTHLLHAIGNYLKQSNPKLKIEYVTCDQFTNDYIESLGTNKEKGSVKGTAQFREKYRNLDVLMVDDIQFIAGRTSTQEEFFHTFNDLYQQNKQIIISSDRPPKEIETLADRLVSRLTSGLIQDIQMPDFETRVAILRKKAQLERYFIDDDVIEFIAEKVDTNIREMEGLLSKVYFFATLLGKKSASIEEAKEAFKEQIDVKKEKLTPEVIIQTVCDYYSIGYNEITGKKKSKEIVEPRMMAIYLISDMLDIPLVTIGKLFGGRDHTTIIHSRDKITELMKKDHKTRTIVSDLKSQISEKCWNVYKKNFLSTSYSHFKITTYGNFVKV